MGGSDRSPSPPRIYTRSQRLAAGLIHDAGDYFSYILKPKEEKVKKVKEERLSGKKAKVSKEAKEKNSEARQPVGKDSVGSCKVKQEISVEGTGPQCDEPFSEIVVRKKKNKKRIEDTPWEDEREKREGVE